ncbi:hypothetical protein [Gulosibacter molinativorax]|uniref:ABC transporter permease n=1 Tax=Gulosibacter molinativorax TaxID=256821 RepID=A0ABT7C520_9MICO|nr:hypothetical protein [Gulosibacter molinativorax]MDJ1370254.1 hypothetical protein [Gulosibacter molinativorax]QUY61668.1 Hypotetical protein [Gulosibacter molinativorax]
MRFREIVREAGRNLASGTAKAGILAVVIAAISGALATLDTTAMTGAITAANDFRVRGASITILTAEHSIDGRVCDALSEVEGIRAAGAITQEETPLAVAGIPQNPLTAFVSTPGFATMLPDATGQEYPGLLLPAELASSLGLNTGDPFHTAQGPTVLGGTYEFPDDGRPRGMGYAAITPTSPEQTLFDECWIDAYPVTQATRDLLYTTIAADSSLPDSGPRISQHNTVLGVAGDPTIGYAERISALFPVAAFLLSFVIGFIAGWTRRLETAAALHAGVRRLDQASVLLLETLAWSAAGAVTSIPVIAYITRNLAYTDHLPVILTASLTPALTVSGAILGALAAALVVREERLFAYFKGR